MNVAILIYNPRGEHRTHHSLEVTASNYRQKIAEALNWWFDDMPTAVIDGEQPLTIKITLNPEKR